MKFTLKARRIGNSVGIIIPKKLGVRAGESLPSNVNNGRLDINLQDIIDKRKGEFINKCFEHLDQALDEKQMDKRFKKEGW